MKKTDWIFIVLIPLASLILLYGMHQKILCEQSGGWYVRTFWTFKCMHGVQIPMRNDMQEFNLYAKK